LTNLCWIGWSCYVPSSIQNTKIFDEATNDWSNTIKDTSFVTKDHSLIIKEIFFALKDLSEAIKEIWNTTFCISTTTFREWKMVTDILNENLLLQKHSWSSTVKYSNMVRIWYEWGIAALFLFFSINDLGSSPMRDALQSCWSQKSLILVLKSFQFYGFLITGSVLKSVIDRRQRLWPNESLFLNHFILISRSIRPLTVDFILNSL